MTRSPAAPLGIVVPREAAGARLDRFLAATLGATELAPSRAELQRWIAHGRVTVDGKAKKASDKVREGACICVEPEAPPPSRVLPDASVAFEVLHVDEDVVVLDKPPGLVVHPARGHEHGTLVSGLLARGFFRQSEDDHERPGIVHRLDKGTSGVMVVARNAAARENLKGQFAARTIDREYVAILLGAAESRTIHTLHARHPTNRLKFTSRTRKGKAATTHVRVLERLASGEATLVACKLETGRTHQIRVHLAETGTPVLGDPLYGRTPRDAVLRRVAEELGHQALHARLLAFDHPRTGERLRFETAPPEDFQRALDALRAVTARRA
jgi:23S rRNA pseudouridine1911/1915/1917 synthase